VADDDAPQLPLPQPYIDAVKGFEGFTPKATWDVNNLRNGYGTNARYPGEVIDQTEATNRLHSELGKAAGLVDAQFPNLPDGHRAALTSLTFNAGPGWMKSGLGAAVGSGDWDTAKRLFTSYNKSAGQVLPGLADRRNSEVSWMSGATPGPGSAPMPASAAKVIAGLPAGPMPDGTTLDMLPKQGDDTTKKNSAAMMALAQQLMAAGQAPKANFMQLAPANTGPLRPLPLDLPRFGQQPT
jgi:lysozyme